MRILIAVFAVAISFVLSVFFLRLPSLYYMLIVLIATTFLSARYPTVYVCLLIVIYEKFFETIDLGIPHWMFEDITLVLLFCGIVVQLIKNHFLIKNITKNIYFIYMLLIIILVNLSTFFSSVFVFGQTVNSVLFRTRPFFLYFIFVYLFLANISVKNISKIFCFLTVSSLIVAVLSIIDARLLGGGKIFKFAMTDGVSGERLGMSRISTYSFVLSWIYFYFLSVFKYSINNKDRILSIFCIFLIIYQITFVSMMRQLYVMLALTTVVFVFRWHSNIKKMLLCLFSVLLVCTILVCLFNPTIIRESFFYKIYDKTNYEAFHTSKGSIAIRMDGIKYFYSYFKKNILLGIGVMSSTFRDSPVRIGLQRGYNFADLGLFSILYRFGLTSILLIVLILFTVFKDLKYLLNIYLNKEKNIIESIFYLFICMVILIPSSTIFFKDNEILYYGILFYFLYRFKFESTRYKTLGNS